MAKYQGKTVTSSRPAKDGDRGFDASKDQLVIQTEDNRQDRTVPHTDVTE